jgi:YidC/Oxa1 family membrane protein insertase
MSKPVAKKPDFLSLLLIFCATFLFMQMCNRTNTGSKVVGLDNTAEVLAEMRKEGKDLDIPTLRDLNAALASKLDEELKAGKIKDADKKKLALEGNILVADGMYRKAISTGTAHHAAEAFNFYTGFERKYKLDPLWKAPIQVTPGKDFPATTITGDSLYKNITTTLDKKYKAESVWGLANGYAFIDWLVALTGRVPTFSYAFAAFMLACVVRAIIWPLAQRQLMWGRKMGQLQPLTKELEEAFKKKDPTGAYKQTPEYQQKVMGMYKEYGINPMSGCLPALAQMPLFLFVYQCMLHYRFAFENGKFLWVNENLHTATNGFVARNLGEQDVILVIVYGISMVISTMLTPVSDPQNAKMGRRMGIGIAIVWTIMMFFFPLPSAFVLYWIFTNILSSTQSLIAYRLPLPPLEKVNAPGGGVFPKGPTDFSANLEGMFGRNGGPKPQKPKKKG